MGDNVIMHLIMDTLSVTASDFVTNRLKVNESPLLRNSLPYPLYFGDLILGFSCKVSMHQSFSGITFAVSF